MVDEADVLLLARAVKTLHESGRAREREAEEAATAATAREDSLRSECDELSRRLSALHARSAAELEGGVSAARRERDDAMREAEVVRDAAAATRRERDDALNKIEALREAAEVTRNERDEALRKAEVVCDVAATARHERDAAVREADTLRDDALAVKAERAEAIREAEASRDAATAAARERDAARSEMRDALAVKAGKIDELECEIAALRAEASAAAAVARTTERDLADARSALGELRAELRSRDETAAARDESAAAALRPLIALIAPARRRQLLAACAHDDAPSWSQRSLSGYDPFVESAGSQERDCAGAKSPTLHQAPRKAQPAGRGADGGEHCAHAAPLGDSTNF